MIEGERAGSSATIRTSAKAAFAAARALPVLRRAVRLLRHGGLTETLEAMAPSGSRAGDAEPASAAASDAGKRTAKGVERASRLVRGADCLPQAVALTALLRARGAAPTLTLGCRRTADGEWHAHAWVELDGAVLPPGADEGFQTLARCRAVDRWRPDAGRADDGRPSRPSSRTRS